MTDIFVVATTVETGLSALAKQESDLAAGLQNVAPGNKVNAPNNSIQYLQASADKNTELAAKCHQLLGHSPPGARR